jgi:hypothetical protein
MNVGHKYYDLHLKIWYLKSAWKTEYIYITFKHFFDFYFFREFFDLTLRGGTGKIFEKNGSRKKWKSKKMFESDVNILSFSCWFQISYYLSVNHNKIYWILAKKRSKIVLEVQYVWDFIERSIFVPRYFYIIL